MKVGKISHKFNNRGKKDFCLTSGLYNGAKNRIQQLFQSENAMQTKCETHKDVNISLCSSFR